MSTRRHFLGSLPLVGVTLSPFAADAQGAGPSDEFADTRASWVTMLTRVAEPVLAGLAANELKLRMPVEGPKAQQRRSVTHLEALGRTLAGVAPWLAARELEAEEEKRRARLSAVTRRALSRAVDPASADRVDFTAGAQNLVDAAFLALGLARARTELWERLDGETRSQLTLALQSTRKFKPPRSNWLLFSAVVEAFLASVGAEWNAEAIDAAMNAHEEWYKGDGAYGDGPAFHWDYYNSFVIQPMLILVIELMQPISPRWAGLREKVLQRARRCAAVQERFIGPDGSFPPLGRSITYRCGAFHHLAFMALRRELPERVKPAQVRGALGAVIRRTLGAPSTFDENGWLRIGLAGHQPALAEEYITTGSLYLCTLAFLPLGLPPTDEFWTAPAEDWTSRKAWNGVDLPPDHAI